MNRSDLFHSRSFRIFLAVCAALLVLMIGTAGFGGAAPSNILSFFATPMQRVSTLVTNNAAVSARDASFPRGAAGRKQRAAPPDLRAAEPARGLL